MTKLLCLCILCLPACTSKEIIITKEVKVPVIVYNKIQKPQKPSLVLSGVQADTSCVKQLQYSYASMLQLVGYTKELESLIDANNKDINGD